MNKREKLSTAEIATHLGRTQATIYNMRKRGLPFYNSGKGTEAHYYMEEVDEWMKESSKKSLIKG